ncbi:MAG: cadherin repeat domain-containing protein [Planctomycetota bacterium]
MQPTGLSVERFEERRLLAVTSPALLAAPFGGSTTAAAVFPAPAVASQGFSFGVKHVNQDGADRYLVDTSGMRKYSEWQTPPITYWGPSANGVEGRLVYRFDFAAPAQSIALKASSATWDFNTEPGGRGRGVSAIQVSPDGRSWVTLRDNIAPRNWGGDWSVDEALPAALAGATTLWVRMRFLVEGAPNSSYTVAQFGRSTSTATTNIFAVEARLRTGNSAPSGISLSSVALAENSAPGTPVGTLVASDPNVGDTFSYRLVTGEGSADNAAFEIVGNQLRARTGFDFESRRTATIRVRATDQGGLSFDRSFTIEIRNVNERPTGVAISSASVNVGNAIGAVVGMFTASDPDAGDRHTFSLVNGPTANDNAMFRIFGGQLQAGVSFGTTARTAYTVRLRATDTGGLAFDRDLTITVTPAVSRLVRLSQVPGEGYARLVQGGIFLEKGQTYTFTMRMVGPVTLQATDHVPEFWGNGLIFDGTAKRSWMQGDWTYYESTVTAPATGTYELKLALRSRQSLVVTDVSLRSSTTGAELVKNGRFLEGIANWYTHGGRLTMQ